MRSRRKGKQFSVFYGERHHGERGETGSGGLKYEGQEASRVLLEQEEK